MATTRTPAEDAPSEDAPEREAPRGESLWDKMERERTQQRSRNAQAEADALAANAATNKRVEAYSRRATEDSEIRAGLLEPAE